MTPVFTKIKVGNEVDMNWSEDVAWVIPTTAARAKAVEVQLVVCDICLRCPRLAFCGPLWPYFSLKMRRASARFRASPMVKSRPETARSHIIILDCRISEDWKRDRVVSLFLPWTLTPESKGLVEPKKISII